MTEVITTSSTGGQKGMKPERFDLLPPEALAAISRVYAFGAEKYDDHNWRKRYEWSKSYAALQRHLNAFWAGETLDPESGLPHLGHAAFHVLALLTYLEADGEGPENEMDDRYRPAEVVPSRQDDAVEAAPVEESANQAWARIKEHLPDGLYFNIGGVVLGPDSVINPDYYSVIASDGSVFQMGSSGEWLLLSSPSGGGKSRLGDGEWTWKEIHEAYADGYLFMGRKEVSICHMTRASEHERRVDSYGTIWERESGSFDWSAYPRPMGPDGSASRAVPLWGWVLP